MSERQNPPEVIWADHDYDKSDGTCGLHLNAHNASGNPGMQGFEPIHYIRSDIVAEMVYDQHITYDGHKELTQKEQ